MTDSRGDRAGLNLALLPNLSAPRDRRGQGRDGSMIAIACAWRSGTPWSRTYRRGWRVAVSRRGRSCPATTRTNMSGPGRSGGSPGRMPGNWTPAGGKVDKRAVLPHRNVADPRDQGRFDQGPVRGADAGAPPGSAWWQDRPWRPVIRPAMNVPVPAGLVSAGLVSAGLVSAGPATARPAVSSPRTHGGW